MSEGSHRLINRIIQASWVLIWFGAILAVNPRPDLSRLGAVLWGAGILMQMSVGARWLIGPPASRITVR